MEKLFPEPSALWGWVGAIRQHVRSPGIPQVLGHNLVLGHNFGVLPRGSPCVVTTQPGLTFMCNFALISKLSVVCLLVSGPSGTSIFSFSKHNRRWARLQDMDTAQ